MSDDKLEIGSVNMNNSVFIGGDNSGEVTVNANESKARIDLAKLADELTQLRGEMRKEAQTDEHDMALGEVAKAEKAARANNQNVTLQHLKAAGQWALDVATKIGVPVAIEVLKAVLKPV